MKMKYLSLAVASAVGAMALPAQADLVIAPDGVGQILLVPYYSAQAGNDTLLNIINTDGANGKALKVRFRSALDSDDVFDFHVYLSPSDMWTGKVSMNPATGLARMETSDNSCTRPESVNQDFVTSRLNPAYSAAEKANQTREGYIEILTMADIMEYDGLASNSTMTTKEVWEASVTSAAGKAASVYYQTKHVAGVAPCDPLVLAKIGKTQALFDDLTRPTDGITANWTIINVPGASAFAGGATAVRVVSSSGAPVSGNLVYFDQNALQENLTGLQSVDVGDALNTLTADNVLLQTGFAWANYDLPDLSTPYDPLVGTGASAPTLQAEALSLALLTGSVANEYIKIDSVSANTDWVISMPTKRYHVAGRGRTTEGVATTTTGFYAGTGKLGPTAAFSNGSVTGAADQVVRYADDGRSSCVRVGGYYAFDREEQFPNEPATGDVISPNTPAETPVIQLCGEVTVLGINQTGAASSAVLGGSVAYTSVALDGGFNTGWAALALDNGRNAWDGLPVIGQAFVEAINPTTTSGAATYGANWSHRFDPILVIPTAE